MLGFIMEDEDQCEECNDSCCEPCNGDPGIIEEIIRVEVDEED